MSPTVSGPQAAEALARFLAARGGTMLCSQMPEFYREHPECVAAIRTGKKANIRNFCDAHPGRLRFVANTGCGSLEVAEEWKARQKKKKMTVAAQQEKVAPPPPPPQPEQLARDNILKLVSAVHECGRLSPGDVGKLVLPLKKIIAELGGLRPLAAAFPDFFFYAGSGGSAALHLSNKLQKLGRCLCRIVLEGEGKAECGQTVATLYREDVEFKDLISKLGGAPQLAKAFSAAIAFRSGRQQHFLQRECVEPSEIGASSSSSSSPRTGAAGRALHEDIAKGATGPSVAPGSGAAARGQRRARREELPSPPPPPPPASTLPARPGPAEAEATPAEAAPAEACNGGRKSGGKLTVLQDLARQVRSSKHNALAAWQKELEQVVAKLADECCRLEARERRLQQWEGAQVRQGDRPLCGDRGDAEKAEGEKDRIPRRQPMEKVGKKVTVRKHTSMGCAVVSLPEPQVREAILRACGDEIFINGIRAQIKPCTDKETQQDIPTDIFAAWGRQVEKTSPVSERELMKFFDRKCTEVQEQERQRKLVEVAARLADERCRLEAMERRLQQWEGAQVEQGEPAETDDKRPERAHDNSGTTTPSAATNDAAGWQRYLDGASRRFWLYHPATGECVWDEDVGGEAAT